MAYTSSNIQPPSFGQPDPRLQPQGVFGTQPVSNKPAITTDPSLIDRLFTGQPQPNNGYADLASILGAFSSGKKADRLVQGSATSDYDRMMAALEATRNANALNANTQYDTSMLAAQTGRNQNEADAWRKLGQTSYALGGGSQFKMPTLSYGGQSMSLPDFGLAPPKVSDAQKAGAQTLQDTIMSRFGEEGSYQPTRFTPDQSFQPHPFEDYGAKPGALENIGSYGGAIVGGIGAIDKLMGNGGDDGSGGGVLGKAGGLVGGLKKLGGLFGGGGNGMNAAQLAGAPGLGATGEGIVEGSGLAGIGEGAAGSTMSNMLGKAIPVAGALYGGYQLAKGGSTGHNIASGAGTGASIGTMIAPGIGTAIGAGIGGLAGAFRNGFRGSKTENEGRTTGAQAVQQIATGATPAQVQEAQGAGWENPSDALASIVMRDRLQAAGKDPSSAGMYLNLIKQAEKAGPDAVQSVIQRIMGEFSQQTPGQFGQPSAQLRPAAPGLTPGGPGTYRG